MNPQFIEWLLRGGNIGVLIGAAGVLLKVNARLSRDETLKADYPPHRHINGKIIFPREYEPATVEKLHP